MDDADRIDADDARALIDARRREVRERLDRAEGRLTDVRVARGDWTDEEHDPEGFALVTEWSQAEGLRAQLRAELAELDHAEARVAAGAYGTCARCGRAIPRPQLARRPARTECVACADARASRG